MKCQKIRNQESIGHRCFALGALFMFEPGSWLGESKNLCCAPNLPSTPSVPQSTSSLHLGVWVRPGCILGPLWASYLWNRGLVAAFACLGPECPF